MSEEAAPSEDSQANTGSDPWARFVPSARAVCTICSCTDGMAIGFAGLMKCRRCGTTYQGARNMLDSLYADDVYLTRYIELGDEARRNIRRYHLEMIHTVANLGVTGRVLDIGCSTGLFLSMLPEQTWERIGVDISPVAAREARERFRLDVHVGDVKSAGFPDEHFDLVTLWHTLEHIPDPIQTLAEVRRILKPSGYLVIAVPNGDSLQLQLFREHWFFLSDPSHLTYFSPRTLTMALHACGFRVVQIRHSVRQHNLGGITASFRRLVRDQPKVRSWAASSRRASDLGTTSGQFPLGLGGVARRVLWWALDELALLIWGLEVLLRRGGTIEVCAQKDSDETQ